MDSHLGDRGTASSFCTFQFFDCFATKKEHVQHRISALPTVTREMNVLYQQPHLVEPMKLRVYEDLPATPITPEMSQLTQWGRNLASRASSRASRISARRRTTSKSLISKPLPIPEVSNDLPLRRRREFTPLQLSIYVDENRLSDLPEFDRFSFTSAGELKRPVKALIRTHSENILRTQETLAIQPPKRTVSMFEPGAVAIARPETSYSIISMSRPPSEYDALHSHPVSCVSLPSSLAPKSQKSENMKKVLTPMQEEFSPIATVTVDGLVLEFPKSVQPDTTTDSTEALLPSESQAPYPVISSGPSGSTTSLRSKSSTRFPVKPTHPKQKRISQWLQYRANSNSTSTISSTSTTNSFAEHRRKRSEFYKLGQQQTTLHTPNKVVTTSPVALPPRPLNFSKSFQSPQHQRSNTESTSHTVGTSVLSSAFDKDSPRHSQESTTTCSTADVKSRTGTVKSLKSPTGLMIITPGKDAINAISPAFEAEIIGMKAPCVYLSEINGPLRSPGVGIAF